nr:MAG TPA: hypothetical protein [Bacteriophage sp.]
MNYNFINDIILITKKRKRTSICLTATTHSFHLRVNHIEK